MAAWTSWAGQLRAGGAGPAGLGWRLARREKRESGTAVEKNGAGPKVKKGRGGKRIPFLFSKYIFQSHFQVEFEFNSNSSQSQSLQKQMCSSMNASTCY